MKVYAEFIEDDGLLFRTKTLLQFGDSWDLIGSIVMKNPGSSKPKSNIDIETSVKLQEFYKTNINVENWRVANNDPTMRDISAIFNGSYVGRNVELNGIIQIFNLFNICDQNVSSAYKKANTTSSEFLLPNIEGMILEFQNKPVYIGFSDFYTNKTSKHFDFLLDSAIKIFEHVKNGKFDYLNDDQIVDNHYYRNNFFYHPQYLNKSSKREKYLPVLEKFISLYEEV